MSQRPIHPDRENPNGHQEENPYESEKSLPYIDSYKENPVSQTPRTGVPSALPVTPPTAKAPEAITHPQSPASIPGNPPGSAFSPVRVIVLVGLVLLVILASAGGFFFIRNNLIATDNANATATARANATGTIQASNATATVQAANATSTAIAGETATAVAQANATATAVATSPYPAFPVVSINDPMTTNSLQQDWYIGDEVDQYGHGGNCSFSDGYYITARYYKYPNSDIVLFVMCPAQNYKVTDFVYQVQMQIVKGDCGGLAFRSDSGAQNFYYLEVCQDGTYRLNLYNKSLPNYGVDLTAGSSSAIKQGLQQKNLVAVAVHGSTFDIYINRQHVASTSNAEYSRGLLGLAAIPETKDTEVLFNNVQVWIPA